MNTIILLGFLFAIILNQRLRFQTLWRGLSLIPWVIPYVVVRHGDEVFTLRDIDLEFKAPPADQDLRLGVNVRRDLLLIFKEAVSNAARHSHCSRVMIDFSASSQRLSLRVADNGTGFDSTSEGAGHGLVSMRRRAQKLNGSFEIDSRAGHGTTVSVAIPLVRAHHHPTSVSR